jgi:hypothetical protein
MDNALLYLLTPSNSKVDAPPVSGTINKLPLEDLAWEDFEKLCLRLVEIEHSIDDCELYGIKGQKQKGIDIFALKQNGKYSSYQCKKYKSFSIADLSSSVDIFKKGEWYSKSDSFHICTTAELNTTQFQSKFNLLKIDFKKDGIKLIKWDRHQICRVLKKQPQIVYDYFGREWVIRFNGEEKLTTINNTRKLDATEVLKFRTDLGMFYSIIFNAHDSGIGIPELRNQAFPLQERFIMPDAFEYDNSKYFDFPLEDQPKKINETYEKILNESLPGNENTNSFIKELYREPDSLQDNIIQNRISIDAIITKNRSSIILGDPGSGKSTLLRNIVLDILSRKPRFAMTINHWGKCLPIWLPFAFITKNIQENNNLSISELLKIWFSNNEKEHLFYSITNALEDERLLLVIDGVDEWTDYSSAQLAITKIEIHCKLYNSIVIYSSRPYGYRLIKETLTGNNEVFLLPFSNLQKREFVLNWFRKWIHSLNNSDDDFIITSTNAFISELEKSQELNHLAENPLLLGILVSQKIRDSVLPNDKTKALEAITDYLINIHPKKRTLSANITNNEKFSFNLIEIFEELAFFIQNNYNEGIIEKSEAKKTIEHYLVNSMGYKCPEARKCANEIFDIGANDYGIIIEKASNEISFTHRLFQEFLAAKFIINSEDDVYKDLLAKNGGNPMWQHVIKLYFSLISPKRIRQFQESIDLLGIENTHDEFPQFSTFLKYDVVLTLNNSPLELSQKYLKEIESLFEYESNIEVKNVYWTIILNALFNSRIKEEVKTYLFKYFPNFYKFTDYRIPSLKKVDINNLTQIQKEFILKTLINGNVYQKIDASNVINHFISDNWLLSRVIELIEKGDNPEIIPFAINSLISQAVSHETKSYIIQKFDKSENQNILFFITKLKVHLNLHNDKEFQRFIKVQRNVFYQLKDETMSILINGWTGTQDLFKICIGSVQKHNYHSGSIDREIAWKILFSCYNKEETVLDRIIDEINEEKYPFSGVHNHSGFPYLANYFKDNTKLIPVLDTWIAKQEFNEPEIAYASLVGRTAKAKEFLLKKLPGAYFSHWIIMALIEGWGEDQEVILNLKEYFRGDSKGKNYSTHYVDIIFKDRKKEGRDILEKIILDRTSDFRDRAILGLIKLDKKYFEKNMLDEFIKSELPLMPKGNIWNGYQNIVYSLIENFKEKEAVKKQLLPLLMKSPQDMNLAIDLFPNDAKMVNELLKHSIPISNPLRLKLVERIGETPIYDKDILERLLQFNEESEDEIKTSAAILGFNILKLSDPNKIISICKEIVFARGFDYEIQRTIAFVGYLLTKRLPEYFKLEEEGSKNTANPRLPFEPSYKEPSRLLIKTLLDNFIYLYNEIAGDFNKLSEYKDPLNQKAWSFWAKYSNKNSQSFDYISAYISNHEELITDKNLLNFLNRTAPQGIILKNICLKLVSENKNTNEAIFAGKILGKNFSKDEKVYHELINITNYLNEAGKIVALCIGWPDSPILEDIYDKIDNANYPIEEIVEYELKFIFKSSDKILKFLTTILTNDDEAKFEHRYYIYPLLRRLEKDNELQNKMIETLVRSDSSSIKVSFFEMINSIHKSEEKIVNWKKRQLEINGAQIYGYNILRNESTLLVSMFNRVTYLV